MFMNKNIQKSRTPNARVVFSSLDWDFAGSLLRQGVFEERIQQTPYPTFLIDLDQDFN